MTANAPQKPRETDRQVGTTKKEGTAHDRASIALPPISVGGQTFVVLSSNSTTILRSSRYRAKRYTFRFYSIRQKNKLERYRRSNRIEFFANSPGVVLSSARRIVLDPRETATNRRGKSRENAP